MMEAVRTSETSVDNYFTRQYNPEDSSEHVHTILTCFTKSFCNLYFPILLRFLVLDFMSSYLFLNIQQNCIPISYISPIL
jgi:hypothetical protein